MGAIFMHNPNLRLLDEAERLAVDAQPQLITQASSGIPSWLSTWIDPQKIDILFAPMRAAMIAPETKKGDWTTDTAMFMTVEPDGEVSSYDDYSNNGASNANVNFPQRQSYHYQTFTQYGEKEQAKAGLAKLDWANLMDTSSILILNKFQNLSYFFGISGLANYGLLNDPNLTVPISATYSWLTNSSATGATVYQDFVRLFQLLVANTNGLVDHLTPMVLAMSPSQESALTYTNTFNVNVTDQLTKNFPNLKVISAPEYALASGQQLMQLIVMEMDGVPTVEVAYTEKLRAHAIIPGHSSWSQKKSQGTWGAIWKRPIFAAQMYG